MNNLNMRHSNSSLRKGEISLNDIFHIIKRRKSIIIITILFALLFAFLYNILISPTYEATVLLKKESLQANSTADQLSSLIFLKSHDAIETDMALVKTRDVLNRVIKDLGLNLKVRKITIPDEKEMNLDNSYFDMVYSSTSDKSLKNILPKLYDMNLSFDNFDLEYTIRKIDDNSFELVNNTEGNITYKSDSTGYLKSPDFSCRIKWPNVKWGSEILIQLSDYNEVYDDLYDNVFINRKGNTNIFEIAVRSSSPFEAKTVANTVARNFKDLKISKQRENIRYSYKFVDKQLKEVQNKLKNAENELTNYQSKEQLVSIDESSRNLINFLSNLETEKFHTSLELVEYTNKADDLQVQMMKKGYVDQTYLTPPTNQQVNSPFPSLLSQLSDLELKKLELLQKRTESHPDVKILTDQINKIKVNLLKYNNNTITAYKILIDALRNKKQKINSLIDEYKYKLNSLPSKQNRLAELMRHKNVYEKMFTLLLDKREEMRIAELSKIQDLIILEKALNPTKPISPNKKKNYIAALFLGLVLGFIGLFVFEFTDKKMNDIYEIERDFNFPILSVIPPYTKTIKTQISSTTSVSKRFVTLLDEAFNYKEAYRVLETKLNRYINKENKYLMITSSEENAGKTTITTNLALTMAYSNKRVLIIDCDIRKPQIAEMFGMEKDVPGLINYLQGESDSPNIYKPVKISGHASILVNIDVLPSGSVSNVSGEILSSKKMEKMLQSLNYYDIILFDTPPITRVADALSLGKLVKNALLVVRSGVSLKDSVSWATTEIKAANIHLCGTVVNDCEVKKSMPRYRYGYGENS